MAASANLPDIYTPSAQLLTLIGMDNRALLSRREDPLPQAVQRLPDCNSQRLEELTDYLKAAEADVRLPLSRAQGLLLYVTAHLVMMLFVHDVLDAGGLDDFLL